MYFSLRILVVSISAILVLFYAFSYMNGLKLSCFEVSRALDNDCYVALTGIDFSAAFDIVDIELLIKRLKILGLPWKIKYTWEIQILVQSADIVMLYIP